MENGRTSEAVIKYNKKDVTKELKPFLESFTYVDRATGGSDELEIVLDNSDMRFLKKQKPLKGATIQAKIVTKNWDKENTNKSFSCGTFVSDDLTSEGPESRFTLKAVSAPVKGEFRATDRTKTYKKATIRSIANKIAKRAKVNLYYDADNIKIKEIEQNRESDSAFLTSLCEDYGLGIKVYNDKIIIYDEVKYEKKKPIKTISRLDDSVIEWSWNTTMQKTYTGVKVTYTDPSDNKKHKAKVGKKGRMLHENVTAFSKKDAKLKAEARLRRENKKQTTMNVTVDPDPRLIASGTVRMAGFGKASGIYFIETATHVRGADGYVLSLEMRKISPPGGNTLSGGSTKA